VESYFLCFVPIWLLLVITMHERYHGPLCDTIFAATPVAAMLGLVLQGLISV
jgi:hypothetical protein